jgi:hypothetical protein
MLTLVAPEPLHGLARDAAVLALLTRIATRADDLLALADCQHIPAANVRADANRIIAACDEARRALVRSNAG